MTQDALKEAIRPEIPALLRDNPALRAFIQDLMRDHSPPRRETDDKFYQLLGDLRRDQEADRAEQRRSGRRTPLSGSAAGRKQARARPGP